MLSASCLLSRAHSSLPWSANFYLFCQQHVDCEKVNSVSEYTCVVSDIGNDLEHCRELQHKLTEENTEVTVNDQIRDVMELAKKISPKHREEDGAQQLVAKLDSVVQKWNSIQDCINGYKVRLGRAQVSHQLVSDMHDVIDIVGEKVKGLAFDDKSLQV